VKPFDCRSEVMAMPLAGTFDYVAVVPERSRDAGFECRGESRERIAISGNRLRDFRLVGTAPLIRFSDAGLTPDAGPQRPWVMRSRITIKASARNDASVGEASFHIDKALTSCMWTGDEIHLTRTTCGGVGLSIIRRGELVAAAGAVTAVPLGSTVRATIPLDLIARAETVFCELDPVFEFSELPLAITVNGSASILFRGGRPLESYHLSVVHGFLQGIPGTSECAAIYDARTCPDVAAHASAMLMDGPNVLTMTRWEG
jgi:hypothetical protein